MKITSVQGIPSAAPVADQRGNRRNYVYVKIETDEGISGWGESTCGPLIVAGMVDEIGATLIGKDPSRLVEIPPADKPEELKAVMTKMGAPADASGYTLTPAEGLPDYLGPDQELSKGFLEHAAKEGMLPSHVQSTYAWMTGVMAEAAKTQEAQELAASETHIRELEAEFGPAFDQKIALVNHAIDKVGGEELRKVLNDAGVGTNPTVIKSYLQVAGLLTEDNTGDGGGGGGFGNAMSPDEARSKGKALLEQASRSSDMAERRRLNEDAQKFFQMAAPGNVPSTL